MYSQLQVDEVSRNRLQPILKQIRFQVVVGPDGASTASHQSDAAPSDKQLADRIRKEVSGTEQLLTAFLRTWTGFAIKSPLPAVESEYELRTVGQKYRLTYHEGPADVITSMDHDFAIEELTVTTPEFTGTVRPKLSGSKSGFMLTSYDATFKTPTADAGRISVKVEYRDVDGLELPGIVTTTVPFGGGTLTIPLVFSDCQVKKR
jgi:hypothetical protein